MNRPNVFANPGVNEEINANPTRIGLSSFVPSGIRGTALAALGVVFGDIGTSPLYAFKQCFTATNSVAYSHENVLGLLSLIVWSLVLVISVKYVSITLKASNHGEGGVLALSSLLGGLASNWRWWAPIGMLGMIGAALFFGDGFITPAISVLSAAEGLNVLAPEFARFVIPLTLAVLAALFAAQKRGTGSVGRIFGYVMVVWFLTIGLLGLVQILKSPGALAALDPRHAVRFFSQNGWQGFTALSSVFLAVTGGEALYADMGHFGRIPIRNAWYQLVLPALLLNYFGQGSLLLNMPEATINPFYLLAPTSVLAPLIVLATCATVIASQAVISGVFSVTSQAINLGYLPRLKIFHSSEEEIGQVYVPSMNWVLFIGTVLLVVSFGSSDALGSAYGIAVSSTMFIAGLMVLLLTHIQKPPHRYALMTVLVVISLIDIAYFTSNLLKFADGGWVPVGLAAIIVLLMSVWRDGRKALHWTVSREQMSRHEFVAHLMREHTEHVPGTAVYLTSESSVIPRALTQNIKFNRVLHRRNLLLTFARTALPRVALAERIAVEPVAPDILRIVVRYGFMESPNVVHALKLAEDSGIAFDPDDTIYIVGREQPLVTMRAGMARWRKRLFSLMNRNSGMASDYFGVPPHRLLEIGTQTSF